MNPICMAGLNLQINATLTFGCAIKIISLHIHIGMMAKDHTIAALTASYITSVVSITLVLFLVGLVGILLLNTKKLSDYVKENVGISVYLNDDVREVDIFSFRNARCQKIC